MIRLSFLITLLFALLSYAAVSPDAAQKLYDQVTPSLVAVQFTWESELGRRDVIGSGIVISNDGLVVASIGVFNPGIPDEQMKDFKIVVPHLDADEEELEAIFLGRDERTNLAFLKAVPKRTWSPITFVDEPVAVGQAVLSIGLMPKTAGYRPYLMQSTVSSLLRGEFPMIMAQPGLAATGSPVFNTDGKAIGLVILQQEQQLLLNNDQHPLAALQSPPLFFLRTREFVQSFNDLPTAGTPLKLPWIGVPQLTGLKKDVAEFFDLTGQPAVEVGDVIPNSPAEKAGLRRGMIIVKMNDKTLERGDEPQEIADILRRKILKMKVGQKVKFTVLAEKDKPLQDISVELVEQPKRANIAKRFYAEDLGFSVREAVFYDTYMRKLSPDAKGVVVALIKPQSSAQSAHLQGNDFITEMNSKPVKDLEQFKTDYLQFRKEKPKDAVVLVVLREGNTQVIRIEPPQ